MKRARTPVAGAVKLEDGARRSKTDRLVRIVTGVRIVAMGALFFTVATGSAFALATGQTPPEGWDVFAAIGGGVIAGAIKMMAATTV